MSLEKLSFRTPDETLEVFRKAQPFLYRVHDKPSLEKLEAFSYMMEKLGHRFPVSKTMGPTQFARFLESVKATPEGGVLLSSRPLRMLRLNQSLLALARRL